MWFQRSGDMFDPDKCRKTTVPPGTYRARVSGREYADGDENAQGGGRDGYRLQLWPRADAGAPVVRKRWAGWPIEE